MTRIGLETPRSKLANASELKRQDRDRYKFERAHIEGRDLSEAQKKQALAEYELNWRKQEPETARALSGSGADRSAAGARICRAAGDHPPLLYARRHRRGIAYTKGEFLEIVERGLDASPTNEVLIEESVLGWKEFEMEVVRDKRDNCIIICSIENIDPMGVHTGDSITIAPALTLTDKEYQIMRDASIAVLREIGVETGGSNVQFAVNPDDGRLVIIEMNPRVSRSSALASKATGFPIAKVAAKLAVGYTLDEIANDITGGATPASSSRPSTTWSPRSALCFREIPRRRTGADHLDEIVGEAMAIGRTFQEACRRRCARSKPASPASMRSQSMTGPGRRQERHPRSARDSDAGSIVDRRAGDASGVFRRRNLCLMQDRSVVLGPDPRHRRNRAADPTEGIAAKRGRVPPAQGDGLFRCAPGAARQTQRGRCVGGAARARRAAGIQAHRYLRGGVRFTDRLHVFDL